MAMQKQDLPVLAAKVRTASPDTDRFLEGLVAMDLISAQHRLRNLQAEGGTSGTGHFEIALHLYSEEPPVFPLDAFSAYAQGLGFRVRQEHRFLTQKLLFVPVRGPWEKLPDLAQFTFIRQIQKVPRLRPFLPHPGEVQKDLQLPRGEPFSREPRVAIFDGGLPGAHPIDHFITRYVPLNPDAGSLPGGEGHGLGVSSAFLFGPLPASGGIERPYAPVEVFRLVDGDQNDKDDLNLYRALGYIREVLTGGSYEFVNISVGPQVSTEDTEVHAWTVVLDELAWKENLFITVAGGNNGASPKPRIEVPADGNQFCRALSASLCGGLTGYRGRGGIGAHDPSPAYPLCPARG
ncbi:MAG: hypothetical protein LBC51_08795 [Treponema sp.]|jgi:hypothetical protein|nr:hypothetical protein [Treponema sp.]